MKKEVIVCLLSGMDQKKLLYMTEQNVEALTKGLMALDGKSQMAFFEAILCNNTAAKEETSKEIEALETSYTKGIRITGTGGYSAKILAIKALSTHANLTIQEAKQQIENLPTFIPSETLNIGLEEMKVELEKAGYVCEIVEDDDEYDY